MKPVNLSWNYKDNKVTYKVLLIVIPLLALLGYVELLFSPEPSDMITNFLESKIKGASDGDVILESARITNEYNNTYEFEAIITFNENGWLYIPATPTKSSFGDFTFYRDKQIGRFYKKGEKETFKGTMITSRYNLKRVIQSLKIYK